MNYTLVTGATSDIGRQICYTLEQSGHNLLLTDVQMEALEETRCNLEHPEKHKILPLDLAEVDAAKANLQGFLVSNEMKVSHAVFAAGIFSVRPLRMVDYQFVKKCFDVSLFSIISLMQILTSKKVNANSLNSVVMVSSVSAMMGTKGYSIYSAVKAAMLGLVKSLTRVNGVLPGGIKTRTTSFLFEGQEEPNPRYLLGDGSAADIADMIDFLLSEKSRWVTGQAFVVDGGLTSN